MPRGCPLVWQGSPGSERLPVPVPYSLSTPQVSRCQGPIPGWVGVPEGGGCPRRHQQVHKWVV